MARRRKKSGGAKKAFFALLFLVALVLIFMCSFWVTGMILNRNADPDFEVKDKQTQTDKSDKKEDKVLSPYNRGTKDMSDKRRSEVPLWEMWAESMIGIADKSAR